MQYPEICIAAITYKDNVYGSHETLDLKSKIVGGIRFGGELLGYVHIGYREARAFLDEESAFIGSLVGRVTSYIENLQFTEQIQLRSKELSILNELARSLSALVDEGQIAEALYQHICRLVNVDDFFIAYYDPGSQIVSFPLTYIYGKRIEVDSRILGEGLTDYIIRHREPLLIGDNILDFMKEIGVKFIPVGDDKPSLSWLGVPILYGEDVLGVINVQTVSIPNLYKEHDRDLLVSVANQAAVVIKNARAYVQTQKALADRKSAELMIQKRAAELETVAKLSMVVSNILDPQKLLKVFVDQAKREFVLYHVHIYLLDESQQQLILSAGSGEIGQKMVAENWRIPIDREHSLVAKVARERQGVIVNDIHSEPDFLPNIYLPDTQSEMAVPLLVGDTIYGVLDVQSDNINHFSEEDLSIQTTLASQVAIALQNSTLYSNTQKALADREVLLATSDSLYAGANQIIHARTISDVLFSMIECTDLKNFDRAEITFFDHPWVDETPNLGIVAATWEKNGDRSLHIKGSSYPIKNFPLTAYVRSDSPTFISDLETDDRLDSKARASGLLYGKTLAWFPLVSGGEWYGWLSAASNQTLMLTENTLRQIESLVSMGAAVIQSQRLQEGMENRLHELTELQRVMSREAWSTYLYQRENEITGYVFDNLSTRTISSEDLLSYQTNQQSSGLVEIPHHKKVPLAIGGETVGFLGVKEDVIRILTEEDREFLEAIAEQVSQALERTRLIEQTQKSAVELQTVASVSSASSTILDPIQLLQSVVDLTKNSFNLYHAHVYLIDETGENLTLAVGAGDIGRKMVSEGWSIRMEKESIVARAARLRQGQIVNDVRLADEYLPNPVLPDTRSEMAIPMIVGNRLLGVFDAQSNQVNFFTEDDLRTYSTLASQTSIALQNAQLFAEQAMTVERLRELDHLKSSFMANMSHELRTPLNSILGFTQVILEGIDGPLTDFMEADLQLIEKNGKHLLNLINEVLDMAKIESGRLSLSFEPVDLRELLGDVLETTAPQAKDKNIYLLLDDNPADDLVVSADQIRMRQVMLNLIGNAIKFTEIGGITVQILKKGDWVRMQFCDTGIGIPIDKLETIFEAFSQVDTSTTRKAGGTGLGLPISRRLVEMHGGRLWAESKGMAGEGSIFHLDIPVHPPIK
jgi:signal transduction histidine kinase